MPRTFRISSYLRGRERKCRPAGGQFTSSNLIGAILTVGFEAADDASAAFSSPFSQTPFGIRASSSGLSVAFGPGIDRYNATGNAFACYSTPQPATFASNNTDVDPSCGSAAFLVLDAMAQTRAEFTGTVTGFTVAREARSGPSIFMLATVVPEPSTWALMLAGFGMVGYSLRRRRVRHPAVTLAA